MQYKFNRSSNNSFIRNVMETDLFHKNCFKKNRNRSKFHNWHWFKFHSFYDFIVHCNLRRFFFLLRNLDDILLLYSFVWFCAWSNLILCKMFTIKFKFWFMILDILSMIITGIYVFYDCIINYWNQGAFKDILMVDCLIL